MKKSNKIILVTAIIILAIALAFFARNSFLAVTGTSTLSLSQASLQSSNAYLSGKAWLLTFSAGGLGQSYYGTITPSDVDSKTPDATRTTKNLNIQVTYEDESCQYPIGSTGSFTPIYDVQKYTYTYVPLIASCDIPTASSKSGISQSNIKFVKLNIVLLKCYVIYTTGESPVGTMGNGNVHAPYTITLNVDGNIASKTIDPISGSTQGAIGSYAYGVWNGNLVSGISCPSTYDYKASYVNGNWRIINKQSYDNYINKYNENIGLINLDFTAIDKWVSDVQYYANQAKVSTSFGTIDSASSLYSAVAKVTLTTPIQYPVTSLYIKADTLGIYTPVPNIGITSTSSSCFKTGENGIISVGIKNTGDEGGTYNVYAICNNPFQMTQPATGSLNAGESRTVNLPLSATATQKTQSTCTVSVETTGGTKTATANVCVDPQITCTIPYPNKFCGFSGNSEVVKQCSQNGATANIIETCTVNQYCELGVCKTGGIPPIPGTCAWYDIGCWLKKLFSLLGNILTIFKVILSLIVLFASFFFSRDLTEQYLLKKSKDKPFVYVIAGLTVALVATLLYVTLFTFIFWIITVLVILFYILVKFTPQGRMIYSVIRR